MLVSVSLVSIISCCESKLFSKSIYENMTGCFLSEKLASCQCESNVNVTLSN